MEYTNNVTRVIENGNVKYLEYKIFDKYYDKIKCITTLRHGGVSKGELSSLNFRTVCKTENRKNALKNLEIICNIAKINPNNVCKASQKHTDNILIINDKNKKIYEFKNYNEEAYDGYITNTKNIATLVTTADCNPIVIYDPINGVVANVHSGWKGTVKKVYLKALEVLKEKYNSNPKDILVCIGPSIGSCCFTSKEEEFKSIFLKNFNYNESDYITYDEDGTFHIDLHFVIKKDLEKFGILEKNISISNICTKCNNKDFYSYRYATMNNHEDYATMATIVSLI